VVSRALSSLLFDIGPHDPVAFVCVTLLLLLVALAATVIPAASATAVDPAVALRCE
jgi:ABC-type lipoprotein release transport system permease subunit